MISLYNFIVSTVEYTFAEKFFLQEYLFLCEHFFCELLCKD